MKKEFINIEDFIEDVSFNRWIMEKSETDRLEWEIWRANNPDKKEVLEAAISILSGIQFNPSYPSEKTVQKELELLHKSIAAKEAAFKQPKQALRSLTSNRIWSIAAAIALILAVTFTIPYFLRDTTVEYQTAFGEFKEIQLSDGSKVALNANSYLKYEKINPRKIWLKGEAFFEVAKKVETGENFQVLTEDLTVEVLGTMFNVKNRNEQTKVFLEEGKVRLAIEEQKNRIIEMQPGELVSYAKNQQEEIEKNQAKAINNTSWKNGVIRFEDAPLAEILSEISAIYGLKFELKDVQTNEKLFSGGVPLQNQAIMLKSLKEVYEIEIEQEGKVFMISKQQ